MCDFTQMPPCTTYYKPTAFYPGGYMSAGGKWVHQCQHCQKYFLSTKSAGVKYGSTKCRTAAKRAKEKGSKKPGHCALCGADIMTGHVHFGTVRKYCSNACRQKAYRDKQSPGKQVLHASVTK